MKKFKQWLCLILGILFLVSSPMVNYAAAPETENNFSSVLSENTLIEEWGYIINSTTGEIQEVSNPDVIPFGIADILVTCQYYYLRDDIFYVTMGAQSILYGEYFTFHDMQILTPQGTWVRSRVSHSQGIIQTTIYDEKEFEVPYGILDDLSVTVDLRISTNQATYHFPTHTLTDPIGY